MASGALGETSRHLRDLFGDGTAVGLGDGQLLARYAASRDEAAFEALVIRHGPMVLATCRAILKHEPDVEDAFQATFLALAREARSVRGGDALGGWLHRVAYRVSIRAGAQARRQRRSEAEAAAMTYLEVNDTRPDPDVVPIVHEELDRLPDRHRLPVVLCDLEGLTYEQAAARLRWTEPTLRHRLVKARGRLRERLTRRGVTAGALGTILTAQAAGARAAVPAALVRSAVATAAGGTASASAAALSAAIIRSLSMSKLKIISAGILATIVLTSVGAAALVALPHEPRPAMPAPSAAQPRVTIRPIGPGDPGPQPPASSGPGIEGRLVDLEGRPVAGARVEIASLYWAPDGDLGRWLDRARDRGVQYPSEGLAPGTVPAFRRTAGKRSPSPANEGVATDADGRFHLAGVGPEQLALIRVTGPTIATTILYATGRDGAEVRAAIHPSLKPTQVVFHPRRFDYAVAPTRPIQGVVRDKDTGRPIAGVALGAAVYEEHSYIPASGIEATTDEEGRYRLAGLPRAPAYRLFLEPAPGQPYPKATLRAPGDAPALQPVTFDIALKRGILVRGRVTDKATGQPVGAMVDAFAFVDNPHRREFPGYRGSELSRALVIDGRYEVVALPGRGLIAVQAGGYLDHYRRSVGGQAIKGYDPKMMAFHTEPSYCTPGNYHALAEINLDPKAETAELDLQVEPGLTITVTPIDPEGRPVAGTVATGVSTITSTEYPQGSSTIEILGLDPSSPRRVTVAHRGRKLIGSVYLKGDEAGPLTIRLQPWGTIAGRIVDEDGRPRGGLGLMSAGGSRPERPAEQGILPGGNIGGGIRIGHDGLFRIEGLVPGLQYGGGAWAGFNDGGDLFHDVIVAPGEVKDLGDLKVVPHKPSP
jgi:RNA polymerase sigma factor (sigma-70 family)